MEGQSLGRTELCLSAAMVSCLCKTVAFCRVSGEGKVRYCTTCWKGAILLAQLRVASFLDTRAL